MAVECRFFVAHVGKTPSGGTVKLYATTKGPNNWSALTPSGTFELMTVNTDAMEWFDERLGKDVRILLDDVPSDG